MYGAHVDTLNVYIKNKPALSKPVFSRKGTNGNQWIEQNVQIQSTDYQVCNKLRTDK